MAHAEALSLNQLLEHSRLDWHGVRLGHPDWNDNSHALAFTLRSFQSRFVLHAMLNAYWEPLEFEVPAADGTIAPGWRRSVDTAAPPPHDGLPWMDAPVHVTGNCVVQPRSLVLLVARLPDAGIAGSGNGSS